LSLPMQGRFEAVEIAPRTDDDEDDDDDDELAGDLTGEGRS